MNYRLLAVPLRGSMIAQGSMPPSLPMSYRRMAAGSRRPPLHLRG
jgi:hypothetical protein